MNIYARDKLTLAVFLTGLVACTSQPVVVQSKDAEPEILTVYADGAMQFNDRFVNREDVVIYPDGYGGERAAIKVQVPRHPDYYRDTIQVRRIDIDAEKLLEN